MSSVPPEIRDFVSNPEAADTVDEFERQLQQHRRIDVADLDMSGSDGAVALTLATQLAHGQVAAVWMQVLTQPLAELHDAVLDSVRLSLALSLARGVSASGEADALGRAALAVSRFVAALQGIDIDDDTRSEMRRISTRVNKLVKQCEEVKFHDQKQAIAMIEDVDLPRSKKSSNNNTVAVSHALRVRAQLVEQLIDGVARMRDIDTRSIDLSNAAKLFSLRREFFDGEKHQRLEMVRQMEKLAVERRDCESQLNELFEALANAPKLTKTDGTSKSTSQLIALNDELRECVFKATASFCSDANRRFTKMMQSHEQGLGGVFLADEARQGQLALVSVPQLDSIATANERVAIRLGEERADLRKYAEHAQKASAREEQLQKRIAEMQLEAAQGELEHHEALHEREKELREREEELEQKSTQLAEIETDSRQLVRQIEQERDELEQERDELRHERERLRLDEARLRDDIEKLKEDLKHLDKDRAAMKADQTELTEAKAEITEAKAALARDQSTLDHEKAELERQRASMAEHEAKRPVPSVSAVAPIPASLENERRQLQKEIAQLQSDKAQLQNDKAQFHREKAQFEDTKSRFDQQQAALQQQQAALQRDRAQFERDRTSLRQNEAALEQKRREQERALLQREDALLRQQEETLKRERSHEPRARTSRDEALAEAQRQLREQFERVRQLQSQLSEQQNTVETYRNEIRELRDRESKVGLERDISAQRKLEEQQTRLHDQQRRLQALESELKKERQLRQEEQEAARAALENERNRLADSDGTAKNLKEQITTTEESRLLAERKIQELQQEAKKRRNLEAALMRKNEELRAAKASQRERARKQSALEKRLQDALEQLAVLREIQSEGTRREQALAQPPAKETTTVTKRVETRTTREENQEMRGGLNLPTQGSSPRFELSLESIEEENATEALDDETEYDYFSVTSGSTRSEPELLSRSESQQLQVSATQPTEGVQPETAPAEMSFSLQRADALSARIFVARDGHRAGPFTFTQLLTKLQSREFRTSDLIWYKALGEWCRISSVLCVSTPSMSQSSRSGGR
ncbi:MAG: hypothetical protein MHM6MM_002201 [Cercozoa sp. M6MM]